MEDLVLAGVGESLLFYQTNHTINRTKGRYYGKKIYRTGIKKFQVIFN